MDSLTPLLAVNASPRRYGNCDTAISILGRAWGAGLETAVASEIAVSPCTGCAACSGKRSKTCLRHRESDPLLARIYAAPAVCVVSPIYFYHLPAQFKAHIDRSQSYWEAEREQGQHPCKPAWAVLVAARHKGEQLFAGSILTLRYFLRSMGFSLQDSLCLYGLDNPGDLAADPLAVDRVADFGRMMAKAMGKTEGGG